MEPTEFQTPADSAYNAVDPPVFFSLPPMMLAGLLLLLLAVALLAWFARDWTDGGKPASGEGAAAAIRDAILKSIRSALAAGDGEIKARAERVRTLMQELLGPLPAFAKGLSGATEALDKAIAGLKPVTHQSGSGHAGGHGHGNGHGHGGAAASAGSPTTIINLNTHPPVHPPEPEPPHEPPVSQATPATEHMTLPEQVEALTRALRRLNSFWSDPTRVREMEDIRKKLGTKPPEPPEPSHGKSGRPHLSHS